jgi:hypothetical protein
MTDAILVLAWLVVAHLAADFVFQSSAIVRAKNDQGGRAARGVLAHAAIVALCLAPVGLAWGGPGWLFVAWSTILHVVIDRAKIVLTRRAAAAALGEAAQRHEGSQPADHLGRAWTSRPAVLFLADQMAHLAVAGLGWLIFLATTSLEPGWVDLVNRALGSLDRDGVHRVISIAIVLASLAIVNLRAASIWVAILVRPVEEGEGTVRWGDRAEPAITSAGDGEPAAGRSRPRRWSLRIGPIDARIQEEAAVGPAAEAASDASPRPAQIARVGATIGILERILIVVFVLTGSEAAIGFVVAAKTLARFRLLDDRDFAEYYLLGTLASVAVAIITGLIARATLAALLG